MGKIKTIRAWGGFCDGKLFWMAVDTGFGGYRDERPDGCMRLMPALFRTRTEAREQFQDVRRVIIQDPRDG